MEAKGIDSIRRQAGYSRGYGGLGDYAVDKVIELTYKAGMREVVRWIEEHEAIYFPKLDNIEAWHLFLTKNGLSKE